MTQDADLQPVVAVQYEALADALASLPEENWETPSLCEGWRVREVIAHLTMPARYDEETFMAELRAREFDFGSLSNEIASRDGQLPVERLVAGLRTEQLQQWTPRGRYADALNHVVIHSLDATVPLGIKWTVTDSAVLEVLDQMTQGGVHQHFDTQVAGRRFEASDLDWSWGEGAVLRGTGDDIILALAGRKVIAERLEGPPL